jgi:hypothetical protein
MLRIYDYIVSLLTYEKTDNVSLLTYEKTDNVSQTCEKTDNVSKRCIKYLLSEEMTFNITSDSTDITDNLNLVINLKHFVTTAELEYILDILSLSRIEFNTCSVPYVLTDLETIYGLSVLNTGKYYIRDTDTKVVINLNLKTFINSFICKHGCIRLRIQDFYFLTNHIESIEVEQIYSHCDKDFSRLFYSRYLRRQVVTRCIYGYTKKCRDDDNIINYMRCASKYFMITISPIHDELNVIVQLDNVNNMLPSIMSVESVELNEQIIHTKNSIYFAPIRMLTTAISV